MHRLFSHPKIQSIATQIQVCLAFMILLFSDKKKYTLVY